MMAQWPGNQFSFNVVKLYVQGNSNLRANQTFIQVLRLKHILRERNMKTIVETDILHSHIHISS